MNDHPERTNPADPSLSGGDEAGAASTPIDQAIDIETGVPGFTFRLATTEPIVFQSFVDCNMASAWVGDRFRVFPGKYGEDPVWGRANELHIGESDTVQGAFRLPAEAFRTPALPPNAPPGTPGLHGAVWFETVYQDQADPSGRTLYALYHNENYPETLPFDPATGEGLSDEAWPPGLCGPESVQAVPRIGVMKSTDGGDSWENLGIVLEDDNERMIRLPINQNECFPGGVGDPCAVASGEHLYVFFGEYAYPTAFNADTWSGEVEAAAQCISVARIPLDSLDAPAGLATRWDGTAFQAGWREPGEPIAALRIPTEEGGGAVSAGDQHFYWGPSVSWHEHAGAWVMLMGRVVGKKWVGDSVYAAINTNRDLGVGDASQQWSTPVRVLHRPGQNVWYPALQPTDSAEDLAAKRTSLRPGRVSRLFAKVNDDYLSDTVLELVRRAPHAE